MSNADFISRTLTFSWSAVSTDCAAMIHYNIPASNCGSCPTTTNHTNVTCTNVPSNGSVCMFAVRTVACGNITGQISDLIRVNVSITKPTINVLTGLIVSLVSSMLSYYSFVLDSFRIPGFIVIGILLLIIALTAVLLFLKYIKRIHTSKYSR